jgi:processing peptidase subunit alpha
MAFRALNSCSRVPSRAGRAYYSSSASSGFVNPVFIDVPRPTLGEYRNGVPASNGAKNIPRVAKVTTLANGLKVASLTSSDIGVSLGLFVGVGARNETRSNAGASHFLKYAAFHSSTEKAGYQVVRELEASGATFTATAGREHLAFTSELPPNQVENVVPIISGLLSPKLAYHEVQAQVESVKEDADRLNNDSISSLFELVHRQAYRNKGLGQSVVANEDNIHHINQQALAKFVDANYTFDKSVFVAVGMLDWN